MLNFLSDVLKSTKMLTSFCKHNMTTQLFPTFLVAHPQNTVACACMPQVYTQMRPALVFSLNEDGWLGRKMAARSIPALPGVPIVHIDLSHGASLAERPPGSRGVSEKKKQKFTWVNLSRFDTPPLYTGGDTCLGLSAICLLRLCILLPGCMHTLHRENRQKKNVAPSPTPTTPTYERAALPPPALRSSPSSWSPAIRRQHILTHQQWSPRLLTKGCIQRGAQGLPHRRLAPSISAPRAACPLPALAPDFHSFRGVIIMFGWLELMRKEKGTMRGPLWAWVAKKKKKKESEKEENKENHRSLCCNLATQQHGRLPDKHTQTHTDRERRRKAECGDDEAASLPGSILRWINTPRGDAALLHCCGQRTWAAWSSWAQFLLLFCISFSLPNLFFSPPFGPLVSAFQRFLLGFHALRNSSLTSSWRWSAPGFRILPCIFIDRKGHHQLLKLQGGGSFRSRAVSPPRPLWRDRRDLCTRASFYTIWRHKRSIRQAGHIRRWRVKLTGGPPFNTVAAARSAAMTISHDGREKNNNGGCKKKRVSPEGAVALQQVQLAARPLEEQRGTLIHLDRHSHAQHAEREPPPEQDFHCLSSPALPTCYPARYLCKGITSFQQLGRAQAASACHY